MKKNQPRRVRIHDREVLSHGLPWSFWQNIYHYSMTISWPVFFATIATLFLLINLLFAGIYTLGDDPVANTHPGSFVGYFFFSVETLGTVGYGDMHPQTLYGHMVATGEIFFGLISVAIITGLIFSRFSRPRAMILFAERIVIGQFDGHLTLGLRIANARLNVINEASARLRLLRQETTVEGLTLLRLHDLALVRDQQPAFQLGWLIMHRIDANSPLYGMNADALEACRATLILSILGDDETTHQSMRSRHSYRPDAIAWNHWFVDTYRLEPDGSEHIDYHRFHDVEPQSRVVS